jgi:hypothetical protein
VVWDLGLANYFWDHVIQISIRVMNFQDISFQLEKSKKSVLELFTPSNQIIIFEEQLCMSYMDF